MNGYLTQAILIGSVLTVSATVALTATAINSKTSDVNNQIANQGGGSGGSADTTAAGGTMTVLASSATVGSPVLMFAWNPGDGDGSESYSLSISGLPGDVVASAGSFGGGVLTVPGNAINSLQLTFPNVGNFPFTYTVRTTESNGGATKDDSGSGSISASIPFAFTTGSDTINLTSLTGTYNNGELSNSLGGNDDITLPDTNQKATELGFSTLSFNADSGSDSCRISGNLVWTLTDCESIYGDGNTNNVNVIYSTSNVNLETISDVEQITFDNTNNNITFTGSMNQPTLVVDGAGGNDTVSFGVGGSQQIGTLNNIEELYGIYLATLTLNQPVNNGNMRINLTDGSRIQFSAGTNVINRQSGNDTGNTGARFILSDSDDNFTIAKSDTNNTALDYIPVICGSGNDTVNLKNANNQLLTDCETINVNYTATPGTKTGIRIGGTAKYTSFPVITKTGNDFDFSVQIDCSSQYSAFCPKSTYNNISPVNFSSSVKYIEGGVSLTLSEGTYTQTLTGSYPNTASFDFVDTGDGTLNLSVKSLNSGAFRMTDSNDNLTITDMYDMYSWADTEILMFNGTDTVSVSSTNTWKKTLFKNGDGTKTYNINGADFSNSEIRQDGSSNLTVNFTNLDGNGNIFLSVFNFANDRINLPGTPTALNTRIRGYSLSSLDNAITNRNRVNLEYDDGSGWKRVAVFGMQFATDYTIALTTPDGIFNGNGQALDNTSADTAVANLIANGFIY